MPLSNRLKQILLIVFFVAIAIGMLIMVYFVFFKPVQPIPVGNANVNGEGGVLPDTNVNTGPTIIEVPVANVNAVTGLPDVDTVARGGSTLVTLVTDGGTVQDVDFVNGAFRYYDPETGEFYVLDADGNKVLLSDKKFKGVEKVKFSNAGKQAILTFEDGRNLFYDFDKGDQATLPAEFKDIEFSEGGDRIAFEFDGTGNNKRLGLSNPNGTSITILDDLSEPDMLRLTEVDWSPTGAVVASVHQPETATTQKVYFYGQNDERYDVMYIDGYGFDSSWSPQGDRLLYNSYNPETGYRPLLQVASASGGTVTGQYALGLYTWQEKCSFASNDSNTLYCGVPNSLPENSGVLPQLNSSPDTIYKIDLRSGVSSPLAVPTNSDGVNNFRVESMYTSPDGKQLYFKDEISGQLYSINL